MIASIRNTQNLTLRLLSSLLLLVTLTSCNREELGLGPGKHPPKFSLQDLSGNPVALESFRGKVVLLNFWASWCAPCISEIPDLQQLQEKLGPSGFVVLGVSVGDSVEAVRDVVKRFGITYPIALDATGEIAEKYETSGLPESFVLDRDGALLMLPDGPSGQMVVRFIGPRKWDSGVTFETLRGLLK